LKISTPDWQQAFKLLDAALEIPAADRAAWLKNLAPEHAHLQPALAELLEQHAVLETESFLRSLPTFTNVDRLPGDAASSTLSERSGNRIGELKADLLIGPYRLIRELGVGGMGAVWLAERSDGSLKRTVALKLPHAGPFQRQLAERFDRERDILAALTHPNIARLYDAGAGSTGQPYLALEYVEGLPLTEYCASKNLGVRERLELFGQVLSAVQYAHNNLVLHRDLKPSNILVTAAGTVSLLDFGIAKFMTGATTSETALTELTGRAMTPDYASPEQIAGAPISTSSDVYSLGVVLYELLTGVRPYKLKRGTRGELEDAILSVDAIRPSQMMRQRTGVHDTAMFKTAKQLDGDLDTVCLKALKKTPEERYATVAAFANDVTRWLNGYPIETRSDGSWYVVRKYVARHRSVVALSAFAVFAMVAGTIVSVLQAQRASAEAEVAREQTARAHAVEQFLSGLFNENSVDQADPEAARRITAPELLDRGAARIDRALADFPDAKADVIATLANMYVHLGDWKKAAELNATRLPLVEKSHGKQSIEYANALIDAADKLKGTLKDDETVLAFTSEAKQILISLRREKSLQFAEVLRFESIIWRRSDLDKAVDTAAEAVKIIRPFVTANSPISTAPNASDATKAANEQARNIAKRFSSALGDLGMTYRQRGNYVEADEALTEAMNLLAETRGSTNFDTAWVVVLKGSIDVMRGNFAEAEPRLREGTHNVLRSGGLQQPASVYAESTLAWFLHMTGRRDEAKDIIDMARKRIATRLEPTHQRVVEANLTYAGMLVNEGRFAEAIALVEPYTKIKNQSPANANIVLGAALALSGENGAADRARALLNSGISIQEARKARNNIWWIEGMLARAELSLAERDYTAAAADFNSILGGAIANGVGAQYTARAYLGLARGEAARGEATAAHEHLVRAQALLDAPQVNGLLGKLNAEVRREMDALKQNSKK
jgi:eukaryotic-like serine/threonine-protein kinase